MASPKIIVSEYDDRQYRHITLPNKLEALLISEKDTKKVRGPLTQLLYFWVKLK